VVCSSNGTFVRQQSGHYEYMGGDTRLVSIASSSNLQSLKEALDRVVAKGASISASGCPEVWLPCPLPNRLGLFAPSGVRIPRLLLPGLRACVRVSACLHAKPAVHVC
jgi:hypothetical protein